MSIEDKYLDKFITKLKAFETTKGSKDGTGLTISEFTGGKATNDSELKDLIISNYITPMKKELGSQYESLNEQNFYELLDYKFNTGRSTADLLAYANKDIDLSKANSKNTFSVPKDISSIDINTLRKAKDDLYKTTNGGTLENPSDAYKNSWSGRVFYLSEDPEKSKNEFKKVYDTKDDIKDTTEIKSKMPKENITGTKETKDLASKNNNPGNLRVVGSDTEFQKFNTMQEGYDALTKQIELYKTGNSDNTTGNETLVELMRIYAPKKDKNNPEIYADKLAKELGISIDTPIKDIDSNKLAVGISSIESPEAYNSLIKTENINLGVDLDDEGSPILLNTPPVPKQNFIVGEDEVGKFVETLINKETENEKYVREYFKGAEQLGIRTIGNNEYVVKGYTDNNGVLQSEYLSPSKSNKIGLKKENKVKLYNREIDEIIKNGLTEENVNKAKDVFETAQEDLIRSGDNEKKEFQQDIFKISKNYYEKAAIPKLQKDLENSKKFKQDQLFNLQNEFANSFGEEKNKIGEKIKTVSKEYADLDKLKKDVNQKIKYISSGSAPNGQPINYNFLNGEEKKKVSQTGWYSDLLNKEGQDLKSSKTFQEYNEKLIAEQEAKNTAVNNPKSENGTADGTNKTQFNTATTKNPLTGTNDQKENPDNLENESKDYDESGKDYYDKDYLEEQLAEVQKQLSNSEKAEEFTPDLSALESKDKYGNLIAQAGDLGAGIIGLQGAMEEVPVYNKGERFNQYTEEAYNQRNMGLSAEESGLRKQLAERGFGYDVKNIRRLSGGSAGVALGNLGRASSGLQNRYAQIAAEDSAVRRMNQQRFDRSAMADENFNRRKFEDSFKTTMLNKEMGAQLVRDKMKNMNERAQFEKQYGEGSIYNEVSKEVLTGKQYNNHALKMAQQYQKQKAEDYLTDRQKRIESDLEKANKTK